MPTPLLGYDRQQLTQTRISPTTGQEVASVLRMFVTMEPILAPPETMQQTVRTIELLFRRKAPLFSVSSTTVRNHRDYSSMLVHGQHN